MDKIEATSRMDFVRNWMDEVRALALKWNSEEQSSSTGDALEFQADYLCSLLELMWEEVQEEDASSQELSSYMSEMTNWISKVHLQRYSSKKDVLVPLNASSAYQLASPAYQVFDKMVEPIDDSEMLLNSPELLATMNASSEISVFFEARESDEKGEMVQMRSPEEVHHQIEVQLEGYDTPIFPSKIAISALPCLSSSLSSTTTYLSEDPIDLESIIPDSFSINEAHSAIKTENNGVSPFLKVTPCFLVATENTSEVSVNLVAFSKAAIRCFIQSVELSSLDFVNSPTASYVLDKMPSREFQLFHVLLH